MIFNKIDGVRCFVYLLLICFYLVIVKLVYVIWNLFRLLSNFYYEEFYYVSIVFMFIFKWIWIILIIIF